MPTFHVQSAKLLLVIVIAQISLYTPTAQSSELWEQWTAHDPQTSQRIDHTEWDRLLKKYVSQHKDGINRVAYHRVRKPDRRSLDAYIKRLANTRISTYNRDEQRAYWINLYNALTVQEILTNYPVSSIKEIKSGLFAAGPWQMTLVRVEGTELSLDDIEHRILRPIWRDPRIHYAVNCASIGCPNLIKTAFTADNAEALMESAAKAYINHPRGVKVVNDRLRVSSIYVWFKEDFDNSDSGIIAHLQQHAQPELLEKLKSVTGIDGHIYDWSLNGGEKFESGTSRRGS